MKRRSSIRLELNLQTERNPEKKLDRGQHAARHSKNNTTHGQQNILVLVLKLYSNSRNTICTPVAFTFTSLTMYAPTLLISNYNLKLTKPQSSFHSLNPNASPTHFTQFQSVSKFTFGFCNSSKRVSESVKKMRQNVGFLGVRMEGLQGICDDDDDGYKDDGFYIRRCVKLAKKAIGCTSPNPMVGCVIVKDGKIVGEGFHPKVGQPHAEGSLYDVLKKKGRLDSLTAVTYALDIAMYIYISPFFRKIPVILWGVCDDPG
ncbi:riboflavin biosynthesis protein PYRD, chloroplastic [Tanacetum coccineum]